MVCCEQATESSRLESQSAAPALQSQPAAPDTQDTHLTHTQPHTVPGRTAEPADSGALSVRPPAHVSVRAGKPPAAPVSKTGVMEGASPSSPRAGPV